MNHLLWQKMQIQRFKKKESNLLQGASVPSQRHLQLQETRAFELLQGFRRLGGVGLAAPRTPGLGPSPLILAQQHGEVETRSVIQLVVYLQTGAVDLDQRGVGHQSGDGCCVHARVSCQLRGQGAGCWSQAEEQLGQRESQQLHRTGGTGDVIIQHHTGFTQEDSNGQLGRPETKQKLLMWK